MFGRAIRLAAGPAENALPRQGQARAADLLSRRRVAHGPVGAQAGTGKMHGQPLPGEENFVSFQGKNGNLMQSPWPFAPAGESGKTITQHAAAHGPARGRHRLRPLDDVEDQHARPRLRVHEHRPRDRRLSQHRAPG